ncbi:MAG: L-rhamnose isomerase [Armatimonadetes bacterium]|nr:L-rhamnose isomerase [Armatimonadota bacterium]
MSDWKAAYELLAAGLTDRGVDLGTIKGLLKAQQIETPSWGYADSGTRFNVFKQPGAAITIQEKLDDAAQVHKFTGVTPTVAVHVAWDFVEGVDPQEVVKYAASQGVKVGAINPTMFQEQFYLNGAIANADPRVRRHLVDHILHSVDIGRQVGSDVLSLWFADGTNYPGQGDFVKRKHWVTECLQEVCAAMPPSMRMMIEYKLFEPGFYHTDIADWGMAYVFCQQCGPQAQVLVDLGHHARSVNIEHIVAFLLDEGALGGFHFNDARYADDDLTTGSVNPYQVFLIYTELVKAADRARDVAYMVDQSHGEKPKIEAMIQTVCNIQKAYAKALLVDQAALEQAQADSNIVDGENVLIDAFNTDVEPLLRQVREEMGLAPDPLAAYRASGYQAKIDGERGFRDNPGGLG